MSRQRLRRRPVAGVLVAFVVLAGAVGACARGRPDLPFETSGAITGAIPIGEGEAAWLGVPVPAPKPGRSYTVISVAPVALEAEADVIVGVSDAALPGLTAEAVDAYEVAGHPFVVTEALLADQLPGIAIGLTIAPGKTHAYLEGIELHVEYDGRAATIPMPIGLVACDRSIEAAPELCGEQSAELSDRMDGSRWEPHVV